MRMVGLLLVLLLYTSYVSVGVAWSSGVGTASAGVSTSRLTGEVTGGFPGARLDSDEGNESETLSKGGDENSRGMDEETGVTVNTTFVAECSLPALSGSFKMRSYKYQNGKRSLEPIVVYCGDVENQENVIVRVHDQCFTSEVFGSLRCDCREQLQEALKLISREVQQNGKGGLVIYLQQEGRGIGLPNKVAAYSLQDGGMDTVDANLHLGLPEEMREYATVPDILKDMKVKSIRLVTNNPFKIKEMVRHGVQVNERISIEVSSNTHNRGYLKSKKDRMQHMLKGDLSDTVATINAQPHKHGPDCDHDHCTSFTGPPLRADIQNLEYPADPMNIDSTTGQMKGYTNLGKKSVVGAINAVRQGKIVLVVDDENRENEGDFIMAAEKATPEQIGFIVRYSSGVLCAAMESTRLEELNLPPMVRDNQDPKQTAYTVSVDWKQGTTTGISALDRAATFRGLADPSACADDFYRPGHVFPLRYRHGGVLARAGHTEASVDLCKLAGLRPCAVIAEVVNDDGTMKRLNALKNFAKANELVITSIQDVSMYRYETEIASK